MIAELALSMALVSLKNDPIESALQYHQQMTDVVDRQAEIAAEEAREAEIAAEEALEERTAAAEDVSRSTRTPLPTGNLPPLLVSIRANESGGNYAAYNPTGCEGYGCGGAYQLHALYASTWAERAGYPGLGGNAAVWPPSTQDAVALDLFYSTNPDGAHWCDWVDYC